MAINKTYLRQMRAYKRLAKWVDRHSLLLNVLTTTEVMVFVLYVFMYY